MMRVIFFLIVLCCLNGSSNVWAGDLSSARAQITGLRPFNFNQFIPFQQGQALDEDLCIYSSTGSYYVQVLGTGPGYSFQANAPGKKALDYQVFWNTLPGINGNLQLLPRHSKLSRGASMQANCPGGNNANLQIVIPDASLMGAQAGSYNISLQIIITPAPAS